MKNILIELPETLHPDSIRQLGQALADLEDRPLILQGTDDCFCIGLDFNHLLTLDATAMHAFAAAFADILSTIARHRAPTMAVVQGRAMGGGLGLAAVCDLVVAGPDATFALPELLYGFVPGIILPFLADRLQPQSIKLLAVTGMPVDMHTAIEMGLVDATFDGKDRDTVIGQWSRLLARADAEAVSTLRDLLRQKNDVSLEDWHRCCMETSLHLLADPGNLQALKVFVAEGVPPWEDRA